MLSLLGVPPMPSSLEQTTPLNDWQLEGMMRQRIAENMESAASTMGALARLIRNIENMAVPETVKIDVEQVLAKLDRVSYFCY